MTTDVRALRRVVRSSTDQLAILRRAVGGFVRSAGGSADLAQDLELVVSELGTNVLAHSGVPTMTVSVHVDEQQWTVIVENDLEEPHEDAIEAASSAAARSMPAPTRTLSVGGRGLAIVASLMDSVSVRATDRHFVVRASRCA